MPTTSLPDHVCKRLGTYKLVIGGLIAVAAVEGMLLWRQVQFTKYAETVCERAATMIVNSKPAPGRGPGSAMGLLRYDRFTNDRNYIPLEAILDDRQAQIDSYNAANLTARIKIGLWFVDHPVPNEAENSE